MTEQLPVTAETEKTTQKQQKERQFKGLSLTERKQARREKLIEAGIQAYWWFALWCRRSAIPCAMLGRMKSVIGRFIPSRHGQRWHAMRTVWAR